MAGALPLSSWPGANSGWWPVLWFTGKVLCALFVFIWLRGTLPRLRYDQFMQLGWKVLVPLSLLWILLVDAVRVIGEQGYDRRRLMIIVGIPLGVALLVTFFWPAAKKPAEPDPAAELAEEALAFPVPPMDLVVPPSPHLVVTAARTVPVDPGRVDPGTPDRVDIDEQDGSDA